jgi:diguanylate cyclase (GGDEF)-like protein
MFYAFITLLLLVGAYLLRIERDIVIGVVGAWTLGGIAMRLLETHFDRLKGRSTRELERLSKEAEKWFGSLVRQEVSTVEKWKKFCERITSMYGYDVALIHLRDKDRFVAHVGSGVDLAEISREVISHDSQLVADLEASDRTIDLKAPGYAGFDLGTLVSKYRISEAYPLRSDGRIDGIVFLGSGSGKFSEYRQENVLALCRLAGRHLLRAEPNPGLATQSPSLVDTSNSQYFEISSKLHKIYNEELLYETFSSSLKRLFNPDFCILCLPKEDSSQLSLNIVCGSNDKELAGHVIESKSAVFDFLVRKPNVYPIGELLELTGNNPDLLFLQESGAELVAPIAVSLDRVGLLGLSKRLGDERGYSSRELEMLFSLCQTLEIVLENIQQFKKIEELSYTDSMTRLYNYRYFYKRLNEEILRARRFNRYLALAIFDLDDFKVFNDSFGHQTGDYLLRQLGSLLLDSVRTIDIVCRYGGEEFCVIMPESDEDSCVQFMERLRVKVVDHRFRNRFTDEKHTITVSAGGGIFPADARRGDRLIYCADMALLEAKKAGKNVSRMFSQLNPESNSKMKE